MVELIEGAARDHASDSGERSVRTDAARHWREPEPNPSPAALHSAGQGAVINDFTADGLNAASAFQSMWSDENAASGCTCHLATRIRDPGWWVEFQKEKHECWNQHALGKRAAFQ